MSENVKLQGKDCSAAVFYASALSPGGQTVLPGCITTEVAEAKDSDRSWSDQASANASRRANPTCSLEGSAKRLEDTYFENGGIGYKLLKKAGYKGKGGLGAHEQGAVQALEAWRQTGREGIGLNKTGHKVAYTHKQDEGQTASAPNLLQATAKNCSAAQSHERGRKASSRANLKRKWPSVRVEEDVDAKVRRWTQVLQAEADEQAGRKVDQYIFCLFRDDSALDTNPLTRYNNLSSMNPLL